MPATYEPIATTTLVGAAATITFSSIPATFTDLSLVFVSRMNAGGGNSSNVLIRFNNLSTSIYSTTRLGGDGASAFSSSLNTQTSLALLAGSAGSATSSGRFNFSKTDIFSYAGSTFKIGLSEISADNNGSGYVVRQVLLAQTTAAINRIDLLDASGNDFASDTTATLYGILKA